MIYQRFAKKKNIKMLSFRNKIQQNSIVKEGGTKDSQTVAKKRQNVNCCK